MSLRAVPRVLVDDLRPTRVSCFRSNFLADSDHSRMACSKPE
jgi:hypothetical protein